MKTTTLIAAGVLALATAPAGRAADEWDALEARLTVEFDKAVLSPEGAKLFEAMKDSLWLVEQRQAELRRLGVSDRVTVRFEVDGLPVAAVVAGAGARVVAVQVHQNRAAFWKNLGALEAFTVNAVWQKLTDEDRRRVEEWKGLTADERDRLLKKADKLNLFAKRDAFVRIAGLTEKLARDPRDVDLLVRRGKLYAELGGGYCYPAWTDLGRAVAIDPNHKDAKETAVLAQAQLDAVRRR